MPAPGLWRTWSASLASASHGKIAVEVVDPASEKKEQAIEALGVAPKQLPIVEKNEQRVVLVYSGIVVQYLGHTQVLPFVMSTDTLEYDLVKAIKAAVADKKPVGHDPRRRRRKEPRQQLPRPLRRLQAVGLGRQGSESWRPHPCRRPRSSSSSATPASTTMTSTGSTPTSPRAARPSSPSRASTSRSRQSLTASQLKNDALLRALESYGVKVDRELVLDSSSLTIGVPDGFALRRPGASATMQYPPLDHDQARVPRPEEPPHGAPRPASTSSGRAPSSRSPRAASTTRPSSRPPRRPGSRRAASPSRPRRPPSTPPRPARRRANTLLAATLSGVLPPAYAGKSAPDANGSRGPAAAAGRGAEPRASSSSAPPTSPPTS